MCYGCFEHVSIKVRVQPFGLSTKAKFKSHGWLFLYPLGFLELQVIKNQLERNYLGSEGYMGENSLTFPLYALG